MRKIALFILLLSLTACSLAPTYQRPEMNIPAGYKETGTWVPSHPGIVNNAAWWEDFCDPVLNELEEKVSIDNQNIAAAFARYMEARAAVAVARSELFPSILGLFDASRIQTSKTIANPLEKPLYNNFLIGGIVSYELDLWGRVKNSVRASKNRAYASAADLAATELSMQAELASDYFTLRGLDSEQCLLDKIVVAFAKSLDILQHRHAVGTAAEADVDQAEAQLETAKTQATDTRLRRAQFEHAIATLIGEAPANFTLAPEPVATKFIVVIPDLPSTLLERRPDIAAAELRVKAANADIGVARAAFFPVFNLGACLGFNSESLGKLFQAPSLIWSLGPAPIITLLNPSVTATIFDGGRLHGLLNQTKAAYYEAVAVYRQTVLTAFKEVEDNLAAERELTHEYDSQSAAANASSRAYQQALYRYFGGITTYLEVSVTENTALQAELNLINIRTQRQIASVQLIKALGGRW